MSLEKRQSPLEYHVRLREMPAEERPRERLRHFGSGSLSTSELLAIILRVGSSSENVLHLAERLLRQFGGLPGLQQASVGELGKEHGMGEAKATQVKAALEMGRRLAAFQPEDRVTVRSPEDVANLVRGEMAFLEQEHLRVVLLNSRNQVMGVQEVYIGSVNSAQVRTAEVLRPAVRENCPALVVVHNHPSGDPAPSQQDIAATKDILAAGKLLDIDVLDHVIIGQGQHVSMKELKLGFG